MNVNFMEAKFANTVQHILYLPLEIFREVSKSQGGAFQIHLDTTHRTLSTWDGSIAPLVSDKEDMFLYRTSCGLPRQLKGTVEQIQERLKEVVDIPENLFFEWFCTDPSNVKPRTLWISVEWYQKSHRVDESWSFQDQIRKSAHKVWKLIEWLEGNKEVFWDWNPRFSFEQESQYYHVLPKNNI